MAGPDAAQTKLDDELAATSRLRGEWVSACGTVVESFCEGKFALVKWIHGIELSSMTAIDGVKANMRGPSGSTTEASTFGDVPLAVRSRTQVRCRCLRGSTLPL